jgi:predicted dinucleotide-binding enzyme
MDMDSDTERSSDYQWWRISFSAEDGKTQRTEKRKAQGNTTATQDGEVVGYTVRKVQETEVLQAAREEWSSVLLVYASENAVNAQVDPAPSQLQVRCPVFHRLF